MKMFHRCAVVLALVALVATGDKLFGQVRFRVTQPNRDQEKEEQSSEQSSDSQQSGKRSDGKSANERLQELLQGQGRSNQNQGGQQFRRIQPGQAQQSPFPTSKPQNSPEPNQSGLRLGTWQGGQWTGTRKIQNWTQAYGGEAQPFSSQWYQAHPKAWRFGNQKANVWVVGSLPGVYNWLGWGDVPREYRVNYGGVPQFDPSHFGEWYPLGIYSLMSSPGDMGTRIVQLAIDRNGNVAGNYYDMITNTNYRISGNISRQSQRLSWSLNKNTATRFRAPLYEWMQPHGTISVRLPGGEHRWQFVRLED